MNIFTAFWNFYLDIYILSFNDEYPEVSDKF